jgi:membrane protein YdbS with pleckstrin-like domain
MTTHMKECPYCKEAIKAEAVKCRFCGEFIEVPKAAFTPNKEEPAETQSQDVPEASEPTDELTTIRLSKICMLGAFLKLFIINTVFGGIGAALFIHRDSLPEFFPRHLHAPVIFGVTGTILTVALLMFLFRYLQFRAKVYKVGIDRIECRSGLFSRTVNNIETWRVQDVKLEQPFLQRLFGAGMVSIESTDPSEPHLEIGPIGNAEENFQAIRKFALVADRRRGVVHLDQ